MRAERETTGFLLVAAAAVENRRDDAGWRDAISMWGMLAARVSGNAMLPLKVFFTICLVFTVFAAFKVFRKRKQLFGHDPEVPTDNWASRNLRTWQVALVLILTIELLITMLLRL